MPSADCRCVPKTRCRCRQSPRLATLSQIGDTATSTTGRAAGQRSRCQLIKPRHISEKIGIVVAVPDQFDGWPECRMKARASQPLDIRRDRVGTGGAGQAHDGGEIGLMLRRPAKGGHWRVPVSACVGPGQEYSAPLHEDAVRLSRALRTRQHKLGAAAPRQRYDPESDFLPTDRVCRRHIPGPEVPRRSPPNWQGAAGRRWSRRAAKCSWPVTVICPPARRRSRMLYSAQTRPMLSHIRAIARLRSRFAALSGRSLAKVARAGASGRRFRAAAPQRAKRCCMNWREQPGRAALSDAAAP